MTDPTLTNPLYPIFLELSTLDTLLVGGGAEAVERLTSLLASSPDARVTVIAPEIDEGVDALLAELPGHHVVVELRPFRETDLPGRDLVIAATGAAATDESVVAAARRHRVLAHAAGAPARSDFRLGRVVTRGALKVGVSTAGWSPALAEAFAGAVDEALPGGLASLLRRLEALALNLAKTSVPEGETSVAIAKR